MSAKADWIAVDWGTSNLRVWAMDSNSRVLGQSEGTEGMGSLTSDQYESVLLAHARDFLADGRVTDVVICGMAGARTGWSEAPYTSTPCAPATVDGTAVATRDPRLSVRILSGLCQISPPDVMRGEETQIAGFLAEQPDFDGYLCLPGTHTKWARICDGQILSFNTSMTGEMFSLLAKHSILRLSMDEDWSDDAMLEEMAAAMLNPQDIAFSLFSLRAAGLVAGDSGHSRAKLSGMLLGQELASIAPRLNNLPVVVIGATELTRLYVLGLSRIGVAAESRDGSMLVLKGLQSAYLVSKGAKI